MGIFLNLQRTGSDWVLLTRSENFKVLITFSYLQDCYYYYYYYYIIIIIIIIIIITFFVNRKAPLEPLKERRPFSYFLVSFCFVGKFY